MNEILSASKALIDQVNKRWPNRIKNKDLFSDVFLYIDPRLEGEKGSYKSAETFINQMVQLAKEGLDDGRIFSVSYQNKTACSHPINKFWIWQDSENFYEIIYIVFNKEKIHDDKKFSIDLFKTKTKARGSYPKYPGVSSVKFKRKNKSVKVLQERLILKGFTISEKEIGYYGLETCEAVKKFYRSLGIYSGTIAKEGKKIGPKGWKKLFE
jgi:hypothetical protein